MFRYQLQKVFASGSFKHFALKESVPLNRNVSTTTFSKWAFWQRKIEAMGCGYHCPLVLHVRRCSKFTWSASVEIHVRSLVRKYEQLMEQLADPEDMDLTKMKEASKKMKELVPIVKLYDKLNVRRQEVAELAALLLEDDGMKELANEELEVSKAEMSRLQEELVRLLIPQDKDDSSGAIIEVRAGAGGLEASLFANEIFNMYQRYASSKGWKCDVLDRSVSDTGGIKSRGVSDAQYFRKKPIFFSFLQ